MGSWFSNLSAGQIFGPRRAIDIQFVYRPDAVERVARDRWGRFTSAQAEMGPAMEALALKLQQMQVVALRRAMEDAPGGRREQRGTHYLEEAILSPGNRVATADGFRVGIESAFAESPAGPYWRGLEEGTAVHVGQRMFGLWLTSSGFAPPQEGARDAIGFMGWRNIPPDVQSDFAGMSKHGEDARLMRDPSSGRLPGFVIGRSIIGYHYLARGIQDFIESGEIQRELSRALAQATGIQQAAIEQGVTTAQARRGA